jgi:hypothetical protein
MKVFCPCCQQEFDLSLFGSNLVLQALQDFFKASGFTHFGYEVTLNPEALRKKLGFTTEAARRVDFVAMKIDSSGRVGQPVTSVCEAKIVDELNYSTAVSGALGQLMEAKQVLGINGEKTPELCIDAAGLISFNAVFMFKNYLLETRFQEKNRAWFEEKGFGIIIVYANGSVLQAREPHWIQGKYPSFSNPVPKICSEWQANILF